MLELIPSQALVEETEVDFNLLSFILSRFLPLKKKTTIRVYKSKSNFSALYINDGIIRINTKEGKTLRYYVSVILHEVRHLVQVKKSKRKLLFQYSNYIEYYTSPEEKDARKFEKLTTEVCHIYKNYQKIEQKIKNYELDSFKELDYNYGEDKITKEQQTKN